MNFTELVNEVMARTRQTSDEARTRVGREINDRLRRVTSSVGLNSTSRGFASTLTIAGDPEIRLVCEKVVTVYFDGVPDRSVLTEITYDQWRHLYTYSPMQGIPTRWAVKYWDTPLDLGAVNIVLYPAPDSNIYAVRADVQLTDIGIAGTAVPKIPTSFHDVLMHGALADEWFQLKQADMSARSEKLYEVRLSELRYFIAKSNSLAICQGGRSGLTRGDYLPGYTVPPPGWYS